MEIDLGRGGRCKEGRMLDLKWCTERWGSVTVEETVGVRRFYLAQG